MNLYTQSQIGSKVARIVRVAGKVDAELHVVLCSILDHTREFGDYTQILPLMNGLPNGLRKQGIKDWILHFTNKMLVLTLDKKSNTWTAELSQERAKDGSDFDIVGAMAVTFGDFSKEPASTTLTLALLIKMLERTANESKLNKDGSPKVDATARVVASRLVEAARLLESKVTVLKPAQPASSQDDSVDEIQKLMGLAA